MQNVIIYAYYLRYIDFTSTPHWVLVTEALLFSARKSSPVMKSFIQTRVHKPVTPVYFIGIYYVSFASSRISETYRKKPMSLELNYIAIMY